MQTSQGYIFCILQHFVTKFCNFTDFNKFFTGIYFFLLKSKISLTCKLSITAELVPYVCPLFLISEPLWTVMGINLLRAIHGNR
jgi:predicted choloylglycine hydrolase